MGRGTFLPCIAVPLIFYLEVGRMGTGDVVAIALTAFNV